MTSRFLSFAAAAALFTLSGAALAQQAEPRNAAPQAPQDPPQSARADEPPQSPRSYEQPQGNTGPIDTTSGGARAANPQGDTPPGMQTPSNGPTGRTEGDDPKGR